MKKMTTKTTTTTKKLPFVDSTRHLFKFHLKIRVVARAYDFAHLLLSSMMSQSAVKRTIPRSAAFVRFAFVLLSPQSKCLNAFRRLIMIVKCINKSFVKCADRVVGQNVQKGASHGMMGTREGRIFPVIKPLWLDVVEVTWQLLLGTWTSVIVVSPVLIA